MMPGETLIYNAQGHSSRHSRGEHAGVIGVFRRRDWRATPAWLACFAGVIGVLRRRVRRDPTPYKGPRREYAGVLRLERSAGAHDRAHQSPTVVKGGIHCREVARYYQV